MTQHFRGVHIRIDGDGEKNHFFTHLVTKQLMNLDQIRRDPGSYSAAGGVKELNHDASILDQILVKPMFHSGVVRQQDIRKLV